MYAVPSLDDGIAWAGDVFDAAPIPGGSHAGLGTRNALLSFGDTYLEIIAPDSAQNLDGTFGERLAAIPEPGLVTWAAAGALDVIAASLKSMGMASRGPARTERHTAEGELLVWELLFPAGHAFGGRMPFFIDWMACAHPSDTSPLGGALERFSVVCERADELAPAFGELGLPAPQPGRDGLTLTVRARDDLVTLTTPPALAGLSLA